MATTSLWRVKGWLGKVVIYIENPEKTTKPASYEAAATEHLADVIAYAVNSEKTGLLPSEDGIPQENFISGVNCYPATAREEMLAVKRRFGKEDGTVAYHGYQSFAPGETTPAIAHEIGVKLAEHLWGDRYQVLVATHLDKKSLHNHFVINTVSFIDGIKFHRTKSDYLEMRRASDALCREYGLSVIAKTKSGKGKTYGEWKAEQEHRPTWRGLIRADIDEAIAASLTERRFLDLLRKKGYEIKIGQDISLRPPGKERFFRPGRNFGERYTLAGIRERLLSQNRATPQRRHPPLSPRKTGGFRGLYFHYCYLLGIFPKKREDLRRQLHFLLREDLLKMDTLSDEAKLLVAGHIDTAEELFTYKVEVEAQIEATATRRQELYRKRRTVAVQTDEAKLASVKAEITACTEKLKKLRREVRLCDDIITRSAVMEEKLKTIEEKERTQRKERKHDEHIGRRG